MERDIWAWAIFCGTMLVLMGLSLILGAESHALSVCAWAGGRAPGSDAPAADFRRRLAWAYRLGGAVFAACGAAFIPALASWYADHPARRLSPLGQVLTGLACLTVGSISAARCVSAAWTRAAGEPGARPAATASYSAGIDALMALTWLLFGAWLVRAAAGS